MVFRLLATGLACTLLFGCDPASSATDNPAAGRHTLALDGASTLSDPWRETVAGRALFAVVDVIDAGGVSTRRLTVQLQDPRTDRHVLVSLDAYDKAIPAPGTYAVTADEAGAPGAFYVSLTESRPSGSFTERFEAESGSVTVTASSGSRIEGSFRLAMRTAGYSAPGGNAVQATGTFAAIPGH